MAEKAWVGPQQPPPGCGVAGLNEHFQELGHEGSQSTRSLFPLSHWSELIPSHYE